MRVPMRAAAVVSVTLLLGVAQADSGQVQFSATEARTSPDGKTMSRTMYFGDGRSRIEMSQQGRQVIQIVDSNKGMAWLLSPADKTYQERSIPTGASEKAQPSAEDDPCTGVTGATCRRIGVEDVNGRPAVKWEMSVTQQGQTITAYQWRDQERGTPLKQQVSNGMSMELKMVGKDTYEGRPVEKWEIVATMPNQAPTKTLQWYDPQLKLPVRDEMPGGYVSELKDIRVGPQPDDLFTVPAGYTRAATPAPGGQPSAPAR